MAQQPQDFESAKARLEEIVNAVSDESLPLDDALDLFEEAVALGLKVSDFVEDGIVVDDEAVLAEGPQAAAAATAGDDAAAAAATAGADAPRQADGALPDVPEAPEMASAAASE